MPPPQRHTVSDQTCVPAHLIQTPGPPPPEDLQFELAGPRDRLFFDPTQTRAGIVTCGGLCPGLNNVIRSVFLELYYGYGVKDVLGFRCGYQGLDPARGPEPVLLTPTFVHDIHKDGGTVLGTSRGPVDIGLAVDNLIQRGMNILFTIGGDGTQRGGNALFQEAQRRGHPLADLYDPLTIPPVLTKAHEKLDVAVDAAYAKRKFSNDRDRVAFLFALYQQLTGPLSAPNPKPTPIGSG